MSSELTQLTKKRRLGKTSQQQYEQYLQLMECDSTFRSGTINPTIDPQYMLKKWSELCDRLNSCGSGPFLTCVEWKKVKNMTYLKQSYASLHICFQRFNDWKNSTRAKYRKYVEQRGLTGGGRSSAAALTPTEERGISVWGRVAVTGTPQVQITGGGLSEVEDINTLVEEQVQAEENTQNVSDASETGHEERKSLSESSTVVSRARPAAVTPLVKKRKKCERSVRTIGEELLNAYKENSSMVEIKKMELEDKKLLLESQKLKFEIAKYKFENPLFVFDENF